MSIQPGEVVLSFSSHRSRDRSGVSKDPRAHAVYSFHRASKGGYYRMPADVAETYTHYKTLVYSPNLDLVEAVRKRKGVCVLRTPYNDIGDCWG